MLHARSGLGISQVHKYIHVLYIKKWRSFMNIDYESIQLHFIILFNVANFNKKYFSSWIYSYATQV